MSCWIVYEKMESWGPPPTPTRKPKWDEDDLTDDERDDLYTIQAIFKFRKDADLWNEFDEAALLCRLKTDKGCALAKQLFSDHQTVSD